MMRCNAITVVLLLGVFSLGSYAWHLKGEVARERGEVARLTAILKPPYQRPHVTTEEEWGVGTLGAHTAVTASDLISEERCRRDGWRWAGSRCVASLYEINGSTSAGERSPLLGTHLIGSSASSGRLVFGMATTTTASWSRPVLPLRAPAVDEP